MGREQIVDAVARIERRLLGPQTLPDADQLDEMNRDLNKLRNEAASLGMPTSKINELKLHIQAQLADPSKPLPAPAPAERPTDETPAPKPRQTDAERKQAVRDLFGR